MATASDQLARLLSLLPWLRSHPGVPKAEAAAAFGISVDQLERDLRLAFTCELPGRPEVFIDIDYLDSDRVSVIDPARLVTVDDIAYLEGYCHSSEAVRTFRLDRVVAAEALDEAAGAAPPSRGEPTTYHPSPGDAVVVLDLRPEARWVPEYYPCETVVALPDGGVRATLRTADPRLAVRLALRLGGALRVVHPPEVAAAVAEAAGSALEAYGVSKRRDTG